MSSDMTWGQFIAGWLRGMRVPEEDRSQRAWCRTCRREFDATTGDLFECPTCKMAWAE